MCIFSLQETEAKTLQDKLQEEDRRISTRNELAGDINDDDEIVLDAGNRQNEKPGKTNHGIEYILLHVVKEVYSMSK